MLIQQDFSCPKGLRNGIEANQRKAHNQLIFLHCSPPKTQVLRWKTSDSETKLYPEEACMAELHAAAVTTKYRFLQLFGAHNASDARFLCQSHVHDSIHPAPATHTPLLSLSTESKGQHVFIPPDEHKPLTKGRINTENTTLLS